MDKKGAITALGALAQETRLDLFRLLITIGRRAEAGSLAAIFYAGL